MGLALASQFEQCPTGTRLLASLYGICSGSPVLLSAMGLPVDGAILKLFWCSTENVLSRRNFAPILLSTLFRPLQNGQDALMALTELQVAVSFLPARERELGSFRFLCWLMANSAGTNMMFLLLVKLSRRFLPGCEFRSSQGPWNLAMVCLTLQALEYPDLRANLMGFIEMSQKWYPFAIGLMLSLLNGSVQWETFAAVIFASLWRKLGLERYLPSRSTAGKLEDQLHLPGLLSLLGGQWLPATRPQRPTRRSQERLAGADPDPGASNFQLFGGQGHRLTD